ncbi:hypothetical protein OUZ56_013885 [Daphnia magna]|uniref:Uncharacterized protein n=1 Tax=Daphnia magna TaxID=35525 RepID=A0ABQ9Z773_9CRUS|nr:hypothetical protein OUZ56_013885 [Daphnia magna]
MHHLPQSGGAGDQSRKYIQRAEFSLNKKIHKTIRKEIHREKNQGWASFHFCSPQLETRSRI